MLDAGWLSRKHGVCHITLRDIDIPDFDVARLIGDLKRMHIDVATLFAGGYVAIYPTQHPLQRVCPGLEGRDLYGEIVAAATEAGITIIPCVDIGEIPIEVARKHPELVACDGAGVIKEKSAVTALPCSLGPWIREVSLEILTELVERYNIQAIKWAGASFNGTPMGCQCAHCRARYVADKGKALPEADWAKDAEYTTWRAGVIQEGIDYLKQLSDRFGLTVVGNNVWHLGRNKTDICAVAASVDLVQIEVQSRFYHWREGERSDSVWEHFSIPIESTRYVSQVSKNPPWVVASYFLAWPWRWCGVPAAEQFAYLAQVLANGGSPGINFTTGAPHQHPDQRGMPAIESLFARLARHPEIYQHDASAARIAVVFDDESAFADLDAGRESYRQELHGIQEVLHRMHLPFDLISSRRLHEIDPGRHQVCIVADAPALKTEVAEQLLGLEAEGVGCVWTGAPGRALDQPGAWWPRIGIQEMGDACWFLEVDEAAPPQAYAQITQPDHALCAGLPCRVLAVKDRYWPVKATDDSETVMAGLDAFRLFPEGQAYPDDDSPRSPLALQKGRQVTFPFRLGEVCESIHHPDHARLWVNAVAVASGQRIHPWVQGCPGLRISERRTAEGQRVLHLINTTHTERFFDETTPLGPFDVQVPSGVNALIRVGDSRRYPADTDSRVNLPGLVDYAVYFLEEFI